MEQVDLRKLGIIDVADPKTSPDFVCDERKEFLGNGQYRCSIKGEVTAEYCNKRCACHYIKRENH